MGENSTYFFFNNIISGLNPGPYGQLNLNTKEKRVPKVRRRYKKTLNKSMQTKAKRRLKSKGELYRVKHRENKLSHDDLCT
jgi:hypothetical protein